MNRLSILLICSAFAAPALAQAPEPAPPAGPAPPVLPVPETPEPVEDFGDGPVHADPVDRESAALHRDCVEETGTRIRDTSRAARADDPRQARDCARPGRAYSREDIERTGETDLGRALERLDPAIRRGR
ncbi:hypothetical protein [Coralloluteibacterium thermophilus]|uniref:UrcA family protein n=1 Tax=Coralloluteibacterium thermophilum TaxID=2707049 RepID=A0ABV9NM17_9GAMM